MWQQPQPSGGSGSSSAAGCGGIRRPGTASVLCSWAEGPSARLLSHILSNGGMDLPYPSWSAVAWDVELPGSEEQRRRAPTCHARPQVLLRLHDTEDCRPRGGAGGNVTLTAPSGAAAYVNAAAGPGPAVSKAAPAAPGAAVGEAAPAAPWGAAYVSSLPGAAAGVTADPHEGLTRPPRTAEQPPQQQQLQQGQGSSCSSEDAQWECDQGQGAGATSGQQGRKGAAAGGGSKAQAAAAGHPAGQDEAEGRLEAAALLAHACQVRPAATAVDPPPCAMVHAGVARGDFILQLLRQDLVEAVLPEILRLPEFGPTSRGRRWLVQVRRMGGGGGWRGFDC